MSEQTSPQTTSEDAVADSRATAPSLDAIYAAKLIFISAPELNPEVILAKVNEKFPHLESTRKPEEQLVCFLHHDHRHTYPDGPEITPMTIVCPAEWSTDLSEFEPALSQLWGRFPEAREILSDCTAAVLVSDVMATVLAPKRRFHLFHDMLACVVRALDCSVVYLINSETLMTPGEYLKTYAKDDLDKFVNFGVSIRLFRVQDHDDEMVIDTLGLAALGLPDMQCHFRGLEPLKIAQFLYNLAYYIFENGDVIEDGNTTSGLQESDRWVCRHELSLIPPTRIVLDINPGPEFAAGTRAGS